MNFPGLIALWLSSGLALAVAAYRQLARPLAARSRPPRFER